MIEEINAAYSGTLPIDKSLKAGKKVNRIEEGSFEKMLKAEKIDVPKIDNPQRVKKGTYPDIEGQKDYTFKKEKKNDYTPKVDLIA